MFKNGKSFFINTEQILNNEFLSEYIIKSIKGQYSLEITNFELA